MPDQTENIDLVQAYVLDCLDKEDEKRMDEFLSLQGLEGNILQEELGEYQIITAMLPVILKIVEPDPKVKDKIARRLYRMKDEIRKKKGSKLSYQETELEKMQGPNSTISSLQPTDFEFEKTTESSINQIHEFEEVKSKGKDGIEAEIELGKVWVYPYTIGKEGKFSEKKPPSNWDPPISEKIEKASEPVKKNLHSKEYKVKKKNWGILPIIWILIFLTGLIFIYLYFSKEVDDYKKRIIHLNEEKAGLIMQLGVLKKFPEILDAKDLTIFNLSGSKYSPDANSKLFISFSENAGYLRLANVHPPDKDRVYQLWMLNGEEVLSLVTIETTKEIEYYRFQIPHITPNNDLKFLLTDEPASGSEKPGKKILLEGSLE